MSSPAPLQGRVALVAGATRGAGRGIAIALGELGATVYCTGRSSEADPRPEPNPSAPFELDARPETIEQTARLVTEAGGVGLAAKIDHTDEAAVQALAARIRTEQGALHILVNDIWGGDALVDWGKKPWEIELGTFQTLFQRAVVTHLITAKAMLPLMRETKGGLLVEVTDGDSLAYRGTLLYDLVKTAVIRLAFGYSEEMKDEGLTAVAVTPGYLRSEAMLEHMKVTEETWREGGEQDPHFLHSESPRYVGRGIAALAADPERHTKTGQVLASWTLADLYGVTDLDGSTPHWGRHAADEDFGRDQRASHDRFFAGFVGLT